MPKLKFLLVANIVIALAIGVALCLTRSPQDAALASLTALIAFSPFNWALGSTLTLKRAARLVDALGVGMRSTDALLRLSSVDTAAFSINRMLTTGDFFITDLIPEGLTQAGLLAIAASAERDSTHPLGRKIFETAEARGLKLDNATIFNEFEGNGVEALINGNTVRVGRAAWIKSEGVKISLELRTKIDQIAAKSRTPLVVSMGRMARGLIGLKDEVDDRAKIFVERLKFNGLETALLTAEPKKKANALTKGLSIDVIRAELLPEEKAREIQLMQARGRVVSAISSEERDRPAFDAADVSILISSTDSTVEPTTDFVISESGQLFELRSIASKTQKILRTNRRLVLGSWVVMSPLVAKTVVDASSVPMPPLLATVGVVLCGALVAFNSRTLDTPPATQESDKI